MKPLLCKLKVKRVVKLYSSHKIGYLSSDFVTKKGVGGCLSVAGVHRSHYVSSVLWAELLSHKSLLKM